MTKETNTEVPLKYPVCLHSDCPQAATCLHQIIYPQMLESQTYLQLINPRMCRKDGHCEFYRDSKPVKYARGFTNMQKRMFPAQYEDFMMTLKGVFGRNYYFKRRRGEKLLPPKEQKIILSVLRKVGVTEDLKFDQYEDHINWYD